MGRPSRSWSIAGPTVLVAGLFTVPVPVGAGESEAVPHIQIEDVFLECTGEPPAARLRDMEQSLHRRLAGGCNGRRRCLVRLAGYVAPAVMDGHCTKLGIVRYCLTDEAVESDGPGDPAGGEKMLALVTGAEVLLDCAAPVDGSGEAPAIVSIDGFAD